MRGRAVPERLDLQRRAVDVRLSFPDDRWASVVLTSGAGFCGWSGEGAWRASLGDGPESVSSDDEGRTWAGVLRGPVVVSQPGRLEVEPSGLRAVFAAPPAPEPSDGGEEQPLAGTVVVVVCSAAAADA